MFKFTASNEIITLDIKQSSVGAPCPSIICNEHNLYVAYYLQDSSSESDLESIGLVKFEGFHVYQFGAPNDEAFHGHPLYKNGLRPYGCFEVNKSTWLSSFEKRNSVHACHSKERFNTLKHYVWAFHDTTLEVICNSYKFEVHEGTPNRGTAGIRVKFIKNSCSQLIFIDFLFRNLRYLYPALEKIKVSFYLHYRHCLVGDRPGFLKIPQEATYSISMAIESPYFHLHRLILSTKIYVQL